MTLKKKSWYGGENFNMHIDKELIFFFTKLQIHSKNINQEKKWVKQIHVRGNRNGQ